MAAVERNSETLWRHSGYVLCISESVGKRGNCLEQFVSPLMCFSITYSNRIIFSHIKVNKSPLFFLPNAADDMGLGKTLTMISLILTKKDKDDKKEVKKLDKSISKTGHYWSIIFHSSLLKQKKAIARLTFQ